MSMARRPRGFGHLYRRKKTLADGAVRESPVWWIAYYVRGKLLRESTGTEIKTDADKILRARTLAADRGQPLDAAAQRTALKDLRGLVETDYKNNGRASLREVGRSFEHLAVHFGSDTLARNITAASVEQYKAERLRKKAAPATINRELAALRRGFRLALRFGKVAARPDFSLLREDNARKGFFEAHQFLAVYAQLPDYLKPMATFLYWTGWRSGEARSLQWRQVEMKAGVIRIEKTKNLEPRTIPYAAVPALKELIEQQRAAATALERNTGTIVPWVFQRGGEPLSHYLGAWHEACRRAGLPGRIPHDFRRTAARNMLRAGIPQPVAMKIGGWKTDSVFRRYAIVDEALLAENMRKLAAVAGGNEHAQR
jgi:integrase